MEETLKALFDFQRFSRNSRLAGIISDAEKRYDNTLSDNDLSLVNAAGEHIPPQIREDKPHD